MYKNEASMPERGCIRISEKGWWGTPTYTGRHRPPRAFGAFAVFDIWAADRRGAERSAKVVPRWQGLSLVAAGAVVYVGILHGRGWLFGMPVAFGG